MSKHYVEDEVFKGVRAVGANAPYFREEFEKSKVEEEEEDRPSSETGRWVGPMKRSALFRVGPATRAKDFPTTGPGKISAKRWAYNIQKIFKSNKSSVSKAIRATGTGAPYFRGKVGGQEAGEMGGIYVGPQKAKFGPRGGKIKKLSPTTGKPIYYKKWQPGSGSTAPQLAKPTAGQAPQEGYQVYKEHARHEIGKTGSGKDIHARPSINGTKHYAWDDHRDASHAHFSLTHYLMNMIRDKKNKGKKTEGLERLMHSHAQYALHHSKEAVKDMLHGRQKAKSEEDLSDR